MAKLQADMNNPDTVADLIDWDEVVTLKGRHSNVPEKILLADGKVTNLRKARAKALQEQRETELAATQAAALKDAGQTDVGNVRSLAAGG
jgi:hypothetical protein